MLSAKQGNYRDHFYNVFGLTQSLTGDGTRDRLHSKQALYHSAIEEAVRSQLKFKFQKAIMPNTLTRVKQTEKHITVTQYVLPNVTAYKEFL